MTALLKDKVGVSTGDVRTIFRDFFGMTLSPGGAAKIVLRVADRVRAAYRGIQIVVRRSRGVYPDETGWKVSGWLHWLWVFVVRTATLFTIRDSRGHDVPEEILGADWSGDRVHDGWPPYDFFKAADHQQCLGHFQRRCEGLLESRPSFRSPCAAPRRGARQIDTSYFGRDRYRFQRCANPTKKVVVKRPDGAFTKNGLREPLRSREDLAAWVRRKGEQGGFAVEEESLRAIPCGREYFERRGVRGRHSAVEFQGILQVTDPAKFHETFSRGIGSAKAFGFGLLFIVPA